MITNEVLKLIFFSLRFVGLNNFSLQTCRVCLLIGCNVLLFFPPSFLHAKSATSLARISNSNSVRLFVCYRCGLVKKDGSYNHQIFTFGWLQNSSFRIIRFFHKLKKDSMSEDAE